MAVTMKDVAEKAGVSVITVSRVINGISYVKQETRDRVLAAIEELHYVPNGLASSLRSRQTSTLALLVPDITNSYWTTVVRGVEDEAAAQGYGVFLCNTDEDPAKEAHYLKALLRRQVDGLLIGPTADSVSLLRHIQRYDLQFVLLDRSVDGIQADVIRGDSIGGAGAAVAHLAATGRRSVAFIGGPTSISTGKERLEGYKAGLAGAGATLDQSLIKLGRYGQESGHRLTRELLDTPSRADAILAGNNQIAIGVLRALAEARVRVPEDIAVISFDDIPGANSYYPFLTAVTQPAYEIGRLGTRRVLKRIAGDRSPAQDVELPTDLIVRASCGCSPDPGTLPIPEPDPATAGYHASIDIRK